MGESKRVSMQAIIKTYEQTRSIWKTGKALGIRGQDVWERLRACDYHFTRRDWDEEELEELKTLSVSLPIGAIAERLGRTYFSVAIKLSRLGVVNRFGNRFKRKIPRGAGYDKVSIQKLLGQLRRYAGSLRSFVRSKSLELEMFVESVQRYDLEFWKEYSRTHTGLPSAVCPYCGVTYYPMTSRQKTCTRRCSEQMKRDVKYFGGKRRNTIGLSQGVCQLCQQEKPSLSAHHILGKENDPENDFLIALCRGCHQLVGTLAGRRFADDPTAWENLITLVMARRIREKKSLEFQGVYACVEVEYLSKGQVEEELQDYCIGGGNPGRGRVD